MNLRDFYIKQAENEGGQFLKTTKLWNSYYGDMTNKRSTAFQTCKKIFKENPNVNTILCAVGARGWSAHSASEVLLIDVTSADDIRLDEYRIGSVILERGDVI